MRCEDFMGVNVEAQRQIVSDRRRKRTLDEETDVVAVIMSEIPVMAAVRSTILLGLLSSESEVERVDDFTQEEKNGHIQNPAQNQGGRPSEELGSL